MTQVSSYAAPGSYDECMTKRGTWTTRIGRLSGAVFDHETAQDTGQLLLEELKAVLETETEAVNEFNREELERGGLVPQIGWRAARGRFW